MVHTTYGERPTKAVAITVATGRSTRDVRRTISITVDSPTAAVDEPRLLTNENDHATTYGKLLSNCLLPERSATHEQQAKSSAKLTQGTRVSATRRDPAPSLIPKSSAELTQGKLWKKGATRHSSFSQLLGQRSMPRSCIVAVSVDSLTS